MGGTARTVNSPNYDVHGNRTRITHPDGKFFEYEYDTADRLFHVSENGPSVTLASIFYDGEGQRDELARDALGAKTTYGYDDISRLAGLTHDLDGLGTANDVVFGFDEYNPASQIVTRTLTNAAYEYPLMPAVKSYVVDGRNQYTQVGGATHTWDANGNLTSDGATTGPTTFGYDTENRLVSASGAKNATLAYDPLGRLYQVTSGGATTRFVYDGDRLIAEYSTGSAVLRRYVHGAGVDEPLLWYEGATVSAAQRRYLHADHQGSIVAVSNASGAMQQVRNYDAYGVTAAANTLRFQYTGQAAIPEVGLLYYKARFYNPALGRFMQTDPIGYDDDVNLYAYVKNDPLNGIDPTGTCTGSRIANDDGTCKSTGGFTTQSFADSRSSSAGRGGVASQRSASGSSAPYSPDRGGWHEYLPENKVCAAGQTCTEDDIKRLMVRFAYPGQNPNTTVQDGGRYLVRDEITGIPAGFVTTRISEDGLKVVNTTTALHVFYDGRIVRTAVQRDGAWYIRTHGYGNNVLPGMATVNQYFGPVQFYLLDMRMRIASWGL